MSYLSKHLLHPLLVSLDVLHLPLKTVLHLILDQVDADPSLSVLDTLIVDPVNNKERLEFIESLGSYIFWIYSDT